MLTSLALALALESQISSFVVQRPLASEAECERVVDAMRPLIKAQTRAANILARCLNAYPVFSVDVTTSRLLPAFGADEDQDIVTIVHMVPVQRQVTALTTNGATLVTVTRTVTSWEAVSEALTVVYDSEESCRDSLRRLGDERARGLIAARWRFGFQGGSDHEYFKECVAGDDGRWGFFVVDLTRG